MVRKDEEGRKYELTGRGIGFVEEGDELRASDGRFFRRFRTG
ncbi:MAG: hypothetical protein ACLU2K_06685 [Clostridia bacterium]